MNSLTTDNQLLSTISSTPDRIRTCMIRLEGGDVSITSLAYNLSQPFPQDGALIQVDRAGFEPASRGPSNLRSTIGAICPLSLFQSSNLIILITNQAHHHRCLRGLHVFPAGTGWIEHPAFCLTGRRSTTELCSLILTPPLSEGEGEMQRYQWDSNPHLPHRQ